MSRAELLDLALGGLFHSLADLVDLAAHHIVELTVVPNELNVVENLLVGSVLARQQLFFAC